MKINKILGLIATSTIVTTPLCAVSCSKEETKTWNVSFDTGCETFIDTVRVEDGGSVDQPEVKLEKDGYKFGGWFDNEECSGEPYTFGKAINSDLVLYAKWDKIYPEIGTSVRIDRTTKDINPTTRTATFECSFDGAEGTLVNFLLSDSTLGNIFLKETQAFVDEDGNFYVSVVYIPSLNEETVTFGLKFAYEIQHQPYIQEIKNLQVKYNEPIIPTASITFEHNEVETEDEQRIATFKGNWIGDLPVGNKFDTIDVLLSQSQNGNQLGIVDQQLEILEPEKIVIDENNEFEIKIRFVGASPTSVSQQGFSLNFTFTQGTTQSSLVVNNLKVIHHGGEEPTDEGFLYLYNGSSVLYGQTGVKGNDSNAWYCYYFENKSSMGTDVTDDTTFIFHNSAGTGITVNDQNQVSWDDTLDSGMHWGYVEAVWENDKGKTYSVNSNEIIVNMCDFAIKNDTPGIYNYEISKNPTPTPTLPGGWYCTFNGTKLGELSSMSTNLNVKGGYGNYFTWNSNQNKIEIYWGLLPESYLPKTFTMNLITTYQYHGYTFRAESQNINIRVTLNPEI